MALEKLSTSQIIQLIEEEKNFEASPLDNSFIIKVQEYVPLICCAIHNGHQLHHDLIKLSNLSDYERWYEEDPLTVQFISSFPIIIEACDSRYEYDLTQLPEEAICNTIKDKKCWKKPLTIKQKERSIKKHEQFYIILSALIHKLEKKFKRVLLLDIHSYNYKHLNTSAPLFKINTLEKLNPNYNKTINYWKKELHKIKLKESPTQLTENKLNHESYLLQYIDTHFKNTLVLNTEIKKIYCDELEGKLYPGIVQSLSEGLRSAIINTAHYFSRNHTNWVIKNKVALLSSELDPAILLVDKYLQEATKDIELLALVNPLNLEIEKKNFFKNNCKNNPNFKYKPLNINSLEIKRKLAVIPVEKINDIRIQQIYVDAINFFMDKVDLGNSIGTDKFLYNSLRYFGEPSKKDLDNARFLLYCPDFSDELDAEILTTKEAEQLFRQAVKDYGLQLKITSSAHIVSKVLALTSKNSIVIKKGIRFSKRLIDGLIEHEIGVHTVTTLNARTQPLRLFSIGMPNNTMTQEGLAVFAEYLSNSINLSRLRELAVRTVGIRSMLDGNDFKTTFSLLVDEYDFKPEAAFNITARFYRGGGFTKDYLYLKGLTEILKIFREKRFLKNLLIGKTALEHLDTIDEMVHRGILKEPQHYTKAFERYDQTKHINPTLRYIFDGLK